MKVTLFIIIGLFLSISNSAHALEQYKCFLETRSIDRTPVAILHSSKTLKSMKWSLEVIKSANSYRTILETPMVDKSESSHALYVNQSQGITVSFYLDASDALGFMEGTIKSPAMNGNIKCLNAAGSREASTGLTSSSKI